MQLPTQSDRLRRAALLATAALIAACPGIAAAQDGRVIGSVTVTDTPIDESEAQSSYKVTRTTSATRTDTPLVDVPQSVNIVTVKQIEDQAANSIGDAIRYVPGVFSAQGEGNRETLIFRGNGTTGDFFVDGVRDDVQTYRDLYNIDQLQIFKGPNAMIFGRGGVGGIVNRVTKVADGLDHQAFRLEAGSFEHKRAQFDLGGPLGEAVSYRVAGVYQDSDSYRDGVNFNRWGINPTVTFKLGADTTITAGYEHFEDDRIADRGVSSFAGRPLQTPRGAFFGNAKQSPTWTDTDAGTLFIEHRFSDTMTIRNRTRYAEYDKFYQNVFPGSTNTAAETVTALTTNRPGLPVGTYALGTRVEIQAYNNASTRKNFINQTDFNATFATGAIEHTLLVGAEFGEQKSTNLRLEGRFSGTGFTNVASVYAPVASPSVAFPLTWTAIASSGANRGTTKIAAGYIQDQIAISPMFEVVLGLRYEHVTTKVTDLRTVGFPAGQQRDFKVVDNLWSPRGGLIFKPVENASIYVSYSRTYLPRGGDQLTGPSITNQNLDPEEYVNYELGAKWDVVPGFNLSAALFQLDRKNVLADILGNGVQVPVGRQRTQGVELSAAGEITDQLSIVAAYTYADGKFRDNISGTVRAGNLLPNMPKHSASLWARFDPIEQLGVAAGVIRQGKRFSATDNAVSMPGYTRVDGALFYNITENLSAQLNIENLFNERYFLYAHSNTNHTPGSPRAFKVGLNARF